MDRLVSRVPVKNLGIGLGWEVSLSVKQSHFVLEKGAWELQCRVRSVHRAGVEVGVLRKQINSA